MKLLTMLVSILLGLFGLPLIMKTSRCHASPDSLAANAGNTILFIGSLNSDCVVDTAIGVVDFDGGYLLDKIVWGGWDSLPPLPGAQGCQRKPKVHETKFLYPDWDSISLSSAFFRLNQDTVADVVLYLWGSDSDSLPSHSASRVIALFGQGGLDSISVVDLGQIPGIQMIPFVSMDLHVDAELVEPDVRDLTGLESFVVAPLQVNLGPPLPRNEPANVSPDWQVDVFPNPSSQMVYMQSGTVPQGQYHVDVVDLAGRVQIAQSLEVREQGELFKLIDMSCLAAGHYLVRLKSIEGGMVVRQIVIRR